MGGGADADYHSGLVAIPPAAGRHSDLGLSPKCSAYLARLNAGRYDWRPCFWFLERYPDAGPPATRPSLPMGALGLPMAPLARDHDLVRVATGDRSANPIDARPLFRILGNRKSPNSSVVGWPER